MWGFARESGRYKATYDDKYNPADYTNRFTVVSNLDVDITSWMRAFANTNIGVRRVNASYLGGTEIYKLLYTTPNWVEDGVLPDGSVITNEGYPNPLQGAINYSGVNQMTRTDLAANIGFDFKLDFYYERSVVQRYLRLQLNLQRHPWRHPRLWPCGLQ